MKTNDQFKNLDYTVPALSTFCWCSVEDSPTVARRLPNKMEAELHFLEGKELPSEDKPVLTEDTEHLLLEGKELRFSAGME